MATDRDALIVPVNNMEDARAVTNYRSVAVGSGAVRFYKSSVEEPQVGFLAGCFGICIL